MALIMAGIDYKTADVDIRGLFSFTAAAGGELMEAARALPGVEGCVLLSTCNRTELYLSCGGDTEPDPVGILCEANGISTAAYGGFFTLRRQRAAALHLMMLTAGLRSQIRGEDQILAQVKTAVTAARELRCCDGVLETLFRCAVSASKKSKTLAPFSNAEPSVVKRALEVLTNRLGTLENKTALVIGNGEMGKLAASMLAAAGCNVTMTLRSYKRGSVEIPAGCGSIPYDDRYRFLPGCDIAVSATSSPHFTLSGEALALCPRIPSLLVDLAVPRDIDPAASALPGITCWNIDTLGGSAPGGEAAEKLLAIKGIVEEYMDRFDKWASYRSTLVPERGGQR